MAWCPACKLWCLFREAEVKCPYWDPYCFHPGMQCSTCREEFDFMEGYKQILEFNREKNEAT